MQDDPRSERPSIVVTPENVDKIHDMVLADRRVKIREIANIMGISTERVYHILTEELGLSKVCVRLLTPEQKRIPNCSVAYFADLDESVYKEDKGKL